MILPYPPIVFTGMLFLRPHSPLLPDAGSSMENMLLS